MLAKVELISQLQNASETSVYFLDNNTKILVNFKIVTINELFKSRVQQLRKMLLGLTLEPLLIIFDEEKLVLNNHGRVIYLQLDQALLMYFNELFNLPVFLQYKYLFKEGIQINKTIIEDILRY